MMSVSSIGILIVAGVLIAGYTALFITILVHVIRKLRRSEPSTRGRKTLRQPKGTAKLESEQVQKTT